MKNVGSKLIPLIRSLWVKVCVASGIKWLNLNVSVFTLYPEKVRGPRRRRVERQWKRRSLRERSGFCCVGTWHRRSSGRASNYSQRWAEWRLERPRRSPHRTWDPPPSCMTSRRPFSPTYIEMQFALNLFEKQIRVLSNAGQVIGNDSKNFIISYRLR